MEAAPWPGQPSATALAVEQDSQIRRFDTDVRATMISPFKGHPLARMTKFSRMIIICELFVPRFETPMRNVKTARADLAEARAMLAGHPVLHPAALSERLLSRAAIRHLEKGEYVFSQGQRADYWYLVLRGRIDTLRMGIDGEDRIIHHVEAGQLLAAIVMFLQQPRYPVEARAAMDSTLCQISRASLLQACQEHPTVAMGMLSLAAQTLQLRIDDVDSLASTSAQQRLAAYMLRLATAGSGRAELPVSQRQLAAKLGVRAETVNRLLSDWRRLGYLEGSGRSWLIAKPGELDMLVRGAHSRQGR